MTQREQCQQEAAARKTELDAARAELRQVSERHAVIRKTELEIEGALEAMSKIRKEESGKVAKWQVRQPA
jgi:hypothetical protein